MTRRTKVALLVSTGVFMASLDLFIVNIAFTSIQAQFPGSSLGGVSWVLSAYSIVFAAALVPAGRWYDRVGRKQGFLLGVGIFGLASAICAAAPTLNVLIGARVLQALGAAMLMPTSLGLLLPEFPPAKRAGAVALWSAVGGVAAAAGPPLGGLLVEFSWRWVFLVNVPIALAAVLIGRTLLNEIKDPEPGPRPDLLGGVLLVGVIGLLTWSIVEAPDYGWTGTRTVAGIALSLVLLGLFVVRSRRAAAPIVPAAIVTRPQFSWATLASLMFYIAFAAMLLDGVLFLTNLWGYTTLQAGLALAPGPATAAAVASRGGVLVPRFGARRMAVAGTLLFSLGGLASSLVVTATPHYLAFLPALILSGVGVGLVLPSTANAAFSSLPPLLLSTGIAVFSVARQVGSALGVALLIAVFGSPGTSAELATAVQHGYLLMAGAGLLAMLFALKITSVPAAAPTTEAGREAAAEAEAPVPVALPSVAA